MYYQGLIAILAMVSDLARPTVGANILAFFPLPIYSHFSGFNPLFLELANRGHRVTVVSPFSPKGYVPSTYVYVPIPNVKILRKQSPMEIRKTSRVANMISVKRNMMANVERTLVLKEVREFLNDTKNEFDLVLSESWYSDTYLALGHRYSAPVVSLCPMTPPASLAASLTAPVNPSYVPSFWLRYADAMSFAERLRNAAITWAERLTADAAYGRAEQRLLDDAYEYPGHRDCPPLRELRDAVPLTLVNSHWSVSYARPYPPNVVSVAGMHLRPMSTSAAAAADGVDRKFKSLMDGATDGVIYFSFGSNINMTDMPEHEVKIFVESFRKLRQIVLWKWEKGTIDNLPNNVYIDKWFPQQYILSHRNCKLFITHGGYHSLVEALHYGLPIIGFPFYTDQYYNMRFAVENGFGIEILINYLQESHLDDAIEKIISDSSYKENAERASKIFSDLPMSALNTAVFWVEYVIRHRFDNKSLQTTHNLDWYQYFVLDVIILIVIGFVFSTFVTYKLMKYLGTFFNNSETKKKN